MVRLRLNHELRAASCEASHVLQRRSYLRRRFARPSVFTAFVIPMGWLPLATLRRLRSSDLLGKLSIGPLFLEQTLDFLNDRVSRRDYGLLACPFVPEISQRLVVLDDTGSVERRIELHAQQAVDAARHVYAVEAPLVEEVLPELLPCCAESFICRELSVENVLSYVLEELEGNPFGYQPALSLEHGARVAKHVEVLQVCVQRDSPLLEQLR